MNKVQLTGRLTADPQVTYSNGGTTIARFNVACERRFKSDGQPTADFISCIGFGKTAEFIEKYFKKGSGIEVEGRIQTGSYVNKDNQKVYTTDVVIEAVEFPKGNSKSDGQQSTQPAPENQDFMNIPDGIDEELPFN